MTGPISTPNRPPLWQVMEDARPPGLTTPDRFWMYEKDCFAAELRAIAEWIRDRHRLQPDSSTYIGASLVAAELLAEADRAEAGEQ
jgi:hypothetical protein